MVRLFDKIKGSLARNKRPSTQPSDPATTIHPTPESTASSAPDQSEPALVTTSPAAGDAPSAPRQPKTGLEPSSSPVTIKRAPSVKITRIKRRVKRPRPVIQERRVDDSDDQEKPAPTQGHTISRSPTLQKRARKVRVVRPKVHVAR